MSSAGARAKQPVTKMMRMILSNGATVQVPTAAPKTRPYYAKQDLFEHNAWVVRVLGMEGAERVKVVDFSAFYAKFGGEPDENDVTPPKEPQQSS